MNFLQTAVANANSGFCARRAVPVHAELSAEAPYVFRYISPTSPVVVFQGVDGTECEEFVYAIRNWAFIEGKYHDDAWMADLASSRFLGNAIRWAVTLPDKTLKSWKLLQKALIAKYPPQNSQCQPVKNADVAANVLADDSEDTDEGFGLFE